MSTGFHLSHPGHQPKGDAERNKTFFNGMKAGGFKGAITGDSAKYGSKPVSPSVAEKHQDHIHIQVN